MSFNDVGALVVCGCLAVALLGVVVVPLLYVGRNRRRVR